MRLGGSKEAPESWHWALKVGCHRRVHLFPTLSRGACQIHALEGEGHSSERMTFVSNEAASLGTVAAPASAIECRCAEK